MSWLGRIAIDDVKRRDGRGAVFSVSQKGLWEGPSSFVAARGVQV